MLLAHLLGAMRRPLRERVDPSPKVLHEKGKRLVAAEFGDETVHPAVGVTQNIEIVRIKGGPSLGHQLRQLLAPRLVRTGRSEPGGVDFEDAADVEILPHLARRPLSHAGAETWPDFDPTVVLQQLQGLANGAATDLQHGGQFALTQSLARLEDAVRNHLLQPLRHLEAQGGASSGSTVRCDARFEVVPLIGRQISQAVKQRPCNTSDVAQTAERPKPPDRKLSNENC